MNSLNREKEQTHLERQQQQFEELATSFFNALNANDYEQLSAAAEKIRGAISCDDHPPLNQLISTEVVPHIIKFLDCDYFAYPQLMVECAWIIAIIASGTSTHVEYLVKQDIISRAINLFDHPHDDVKENAIWILANIAGDSFENRDKLLEVGIVAKLEHTLLDPAHSTGFIAHGSWLISNLCKGKPYPPFADVQPLMKIVQFFILKLNNEEILNNCMWSLSYFSDGNDKQIKEVLDLGVTDYIMALLSSDKPNVVTPALRTAVNLVTGKDEYTEIMIKSGIIPHLSRLLCDQRKSFRKEACWAISNIMAGTDYQIEQIFVYNNREIIKNLINMAYTDVPDVAKECIFCLTNMCSEGTFQHIQILIDNEMIELLIQVLKNQHNEFILQALEALENILYFAKSTYARSDGNPIIIKLANCGGFPVIEAMQSHPDNGVYAIVARIMEKYLDY